MTEASPPFRQTSEGRRRFRHRLYLFPSSALFAGREVEQRHAAPLDCVVEGGQVGRDDLMPRRQLSVQAFAQELEDLVLLRGRRVVVVAEGPAEAVEGFVEHA